MQRPDAQDMDLQAFDWHELVPAHRAGVWSVTVSGNWRVTFRFEDGVDARNSEL